MMALAILFGFGIVMNGSTFAAIQGRYARMLELPGSVAVPYLPWIALACYFAAVLALRRRKTARTRWLGFILATLTANTLIAYPIFLLDSGSTRIPVRDLISKESRASYEAKYAIKFVSYSTSAEGAGIRVRKDQYSQELASYITDLIDHQ
jgi:hypothetical protein